MIGLALGAYGLTQALLQLPFGMASDRFGRVIQGSGAISAVVTALLADLIREEHHTKRRRV